MSETKPLIDDDDDNIPFNAMCHNASMMYTFATLRQVVNDHSVTFGDDGSGHERVTFVRPHLIVTQLDEQCMETRPNAYLKSSVTAAELLLFLQLNRNYYTEALAFNVDWKLKTAEQTKPFEFEDELEIMANKYDAEFWEYDDQFQNSELVYGVVVNRVEKRIVIGFRGSATIKDFVVDLTSTSRIPEELNFAHEMGIVAPGDQIKIHRGFNDYLFGHGQKNDNRCTKFEDVIRDLEDVYNFKDDKYDYSEYKLYLTGHSLGGALASLLAVALAGHEVTKKRPAVLPVTAITFASPRVGGRVFKYVHKELEKAKKLRHIRVSNQGDVIPVAPFFWGQTGINIHVCNNAIAKIGYEVEMWFFTQIRLVSLSRHSLDSYLKHLHVKAPNSKIRNAESVPVNKGLILDKSIKQLYAEVAGFDV